MMPDVPEMPDTADAREAYFEAVAGVSRFFSHSLGNLLTGLNLTLDMLAGTESGDPRAQTLVARGLNMMERLCAFKESWSALGDGGAGRFEMRNPDDLLRQVLEQARPSSEFDVAVRCDARVPTVYCHPGLLGSALHYLVRNAVDAMPQGGHLGVDVQPVDGAVRFAVWDTGPGIPVELQSKIFYEPVTTKPYGGGIGLMLVAMITKRVHRGEVHWASRVPHGCSIELTIPTCEASAARIET